MLLGMFRPGERTKRGRDTKPMPQQRDRQAPPRNTRQGAAPMVGASHKSRSLVESCRFSVGTTPRSRGEDFKTQKSKNFYPNESSSELMDLSQINLALARPIFLYPIKAVYSKDYHRLLPAHPNSHGHRLFVVSSSYISIAYMMVFHAMKKYHSHPTEIEWG